VAAGCGSNNSSSSDATQDAVQPDALPATDGCSDAAKLIYLFSTRSGGNAPRLYSLAPLTKELKLIGTIGTNISAQGVSPVAITILRDGVHGYVSDSGHRLWQVNLADASVDPQPLMDFVAAGGKPSDNYTVALVGDGQGQDTLYAEGYSKTFYRVDPTARTMTSLGLFPNLCDLTGTNSNKLIAFCDNTTIQEINPQTLMSVSSDPAPGWKSTWAIAFWGGYDWLFFGDQTSPTELFRFDPATKQSVPWMTATELGNVLISGAGVSSCAPQIVE